MKLKTLRDFNFKDKLVLIRIDINSPVVKGKVLDSPRFKESAETIKYLIKNQAKIVILAHQGRKGSSDFTSLEQHAKILSKYVKIRIKYVDDLFGKEAKKEIFFLKQGESILLKNVRAFNDEADIKNKKNAYPSFCSQFDFYVNDAFSVSHRAQGSIIIPPLYLKSCIGIAFERELNALNKFHPKKGKSVYIIGGQKVEDYLPIFNVLKNKNNKIITAGVLANLILISQGINLGYENKWAKDNKYNPLLSALRRLYRKYKKQIILPLDFAIGNPDIYKAKTRTEVSLEDAPFNEKIWDVGPNSVETFKNSLKNTKSIFMKGPLGYSEIKHFSYSTVNLLKYISKLSKQKKVFSLLGGGHLSTTIEEYKIPNNFSHKSTSGGALIAYISGDRLPGIIALESSK